MPNKRHVALLRGINVGGKNLVPMPDLRRAFEDEGYQSVTTYIQSGNVLFETDARRDLLEAEVESLIERRLGLSIVVVVRSHSQMRNVVEKAPPGFGGRPDLYHSDVIFLKPPLTPHRALEAVQLKEGVDQVWPGTAVLYFARLSERRTQSKMGRIVGTPQYQMMTIRSWSTTTKLLSLLDERHRPTVG